MALKVSFSLVLGDLSASGEMVDAQDLGSCVFDVGVRVPSRPLLFVTRRFCYTRYAREVWWRSGDASQSQKWGPVLFF